jgi:D-alanyl-D-alanine carboxypeptidase/D-alanyl-D-alanine-endopeptidase (penicillin-binding protein 4)
MVRRTRRAALLTLAMINVFTLAAGIAVARMLPSRLAALKVPTVADAPLASAGPVLAAEGAEGTAGNGGTAGTGARDAPLPTTSGLHTALAGPLSAPALGPEVSALVADPATGRVLLSEQGSRPMTPASTTKLATGLAALAVLGQNAVFTTQVVRGATPGRVILVGGGDPTLAVNPFPAQDYPQPATLASLAKATARTLKAQGRRTVVLGYDTSRYTGPGLAPGWPAAYITAGDVTPIVSLEADQGRLTPAGQPEDSDDPYNLAARSQDPAAMAASAFAGLLAADGIRVTGAPQEQAAAKGAATLASVTSPPLSAVVAQMLEESNNVIAENLARQVAVATGQPASFSGAAQAVVNELRRLGITTGIRLVDGSGLSPRDAIAPVTLVKVLEVAVGHPKYRALLAGLPVAGFSGTLSAGESVFSGISGAALGAVRAKTGNLGTVTSLAGLAYDQSGRVLVFALMADQVPSAGLLDEAAKAINDAAAALAGCGCRLAAALPDRLRALSAARTVGL